MKVYKIKKVTCEYLDFHDKTCNGFTSFYVYDEETNKKIYLCNLHAKLALKWGK